MLEKRFKKLLEPVNKESRGSSFDWYRPYRGRKLNPRVKPVKADIRHRHPALLAIEGWYDTEEIVVPEKFEQVYKEWKESGSSRRLTWWALKTERLDDKEASELGNSLQTLHFKLSCRHHDLLRLAETNHYASCMQGNAGAQQLQYLADPDMAVAYISDRAGKFMWRSLVRLVMEGENGFALVHYRIYGNGPTEAIFRRLDKIIPVYEARDIRHYHISLDDTEVKVSPTIHNNKFLSRPIWTDHQGVGWNQERRIQIRVIKREGEYRYLKQEVRRERLWDEM